METEKSTRNFIWSGDIKTRKMVMVSWKNICTPYSNGRLGIRSLISLNEAANLKLCWDMMVNKAKTFRSFGNINYHIFSSIRVGIKTEMSLINTQFSWILDKGTDIKFWLDNCCVQPLLLKTSLDSI